MVVNLSTSAMNEEIARSHGGKCFYSKVGEGNVVDKILEKNAIIGGEGNGGVIYPKINTGRDGFVGIALILELLAERSQTVSEAIALLPKFHMIKEKWEIGDKNLDEIYKNLKKHYKTAITDEQDGLRLSFPNKSWIHLRPSNTEPIIRLFGEAKTELEIKALIEEARLIL